MIKVVVVFLFFFWLFCSLKPPYPISPYVFYAWRDADKIYAREILNFIPHLRATLE